MMKVINAIFAFLFALCVTGAQAQSIDDLNALQATIRSLEQELRGIEKEQKGTVAAISALQKKIAAERQALELLSRQIKANTAELANLEAEQSRLTTERQLFERQAHQAMLFLMENSGDLTAKSVFGKLDTTNFTTVAEVTAILGNNLDSSISSYLEAGRKLAELEQKLRRENETMQLRLAERSRLRASWESSEKELARRLVLVRQDANAQKEYIAMLEAEAENISEALRRADEASSPAPAGTFAALKGKLPLPAKGWITEAFGSRVVAEAGVAVHSNGIKLSLSEGVVRTVAAGNVVYADRVGAMQNLVIVRHDLEFYTVYGNLDGFEVKAGDSVIAGEELGRINIDLKGNSAQLHFEVRRHQAALNPQDWLAPAER